MHIRTYAHIHITEQQKLQRSSHGYSFSIKNVLSFLVNSLLKIRKDKVSEIESNFDFDLINSQKQVERVLQKKIAIRCTILRIECDLIN
jgi:hypothetical protein